MAKFKKMTKGIAAAVAVNRGTDQVVILAPNKSTLCRFLLTRLKLTPADYDTKKFKTAKLVESD